MTHLAEWEQELLAIPPSCVCDWLIEGERVMACRVHDEISGESR